MIEKRLMIEKWKSQSKNHQVFDIFADPLLLLDLVNRPIGPHPLPMFEGHIYTPEQFSRFVPWLCLNHQDFSILVHPNTDDAVADHTGSAIWIGKQLDLNIALMEQMLRQMGRFRK
eukprot:TRINITY_DN3760_c0_g1_i1.p1 TRINITY_DN3760_c0_g1~~TRINITY_DN3760_c0_g1_i1.p1  ORF type:complete len:116 (+),score=23.75 TRINITY_DN3760_c0_g1_i1:226-573(+)